MVVISPHSIGDFVSWSTKPNLLGDSATSAALGIFVAEVLKPVVPSLMRGDLQAYTKIDENPWLFFINSHGPPKFPMVLDRFHDTPKFQLSCHFLSNISPDHLHGFIIPFLSHALHQCVHIWNLSDFLVKTWPFLKLLRSEVSNRPRILRCWINDPYTFQNRCTSWREAISKFGKCLDTGILLLDAIGYKEAFRKHAEHVIDSPACPSLLTVLAFWWCSPYRSSVVLLCYRLWIPCLPNPIILFHPPDLHMSHQPSTWDPYLPLTSPYKKHKVLKIHVPHLLPWSFLQHLQVCFFKGIRIHWESPFKRLLQLWPNYSWLHRMEDHGTNCISTVEVDVFTKEIAFLFFTS